MNLEIRVVSQQPPGGRCTLYAGCAEVLAAHLDARIEVVFSAVTRADTAPHVTGAHSRLLRQLEKELP